VTDLTDVSADAADFDSLVGADLWLLVTRRRPSDDLALTASGPDADRWLDMAQAYGAPAGPGRRPGQFSAVPQR
jgi:hypothetical protein